jgi:hypothetical protein
MTVLIAWTSLSVGIVIGAAWRSLCEKQSRRNTSLADGSMMLYRLNAGPGNWHRQSDRAEARKQRPA